MLLCFNDRGLMRKCKRGVVLTSPNIPNIEGKYLKADKAGQKHAICIRLNRKKMHI